MLSNDDFIIIDIEENEKLELTDYFKKYVAEIDPGNVLRGVHATTFINAIYKNQKRKLFWAKNYKTKLGFAIVSIEKNWPETQTSTGRINEFYIFPEFRRKQYGTLFVESIKNYFTQNSCNRFELDVLFSNQNALAFWKSQGLEFKKYVMHKFL